MIFVELAAKLGANVARMMQQAHVELLEFLDLTGRARLFDRFAPLHLLHQELGRHRGIGLDGGIDAREDQQVLRTRQRLLQRTKPFVDARRPLHRPTLVGVGQMGVAIRMNLRLQAMPRRLERGLVERVAARQPEEGEVVLGEVDAHAVSAGKRGRRIRR